MPVAEVYGLSECTGPAAYNLPDDRVPGSAGRAVPGTRLSIADADAAGRGEVCVAGRNVFLGYLGDPARSDATFSPDGTLRTGDVGCIDASGRLWITGRRKELIVTAGGENVPPVPVEDAVCAESAAVGHAVIVGDGRPYVVALIALKVRLCPAAAPAPSPPPVATPDRDGRGGGTAAARTGSRRAGSGS